jgi:hypothetical protein
MGLSRVRNTHIREPTPGQRSGSVLLLFSEVSKLISVSFHSLSSSVKLKSLSKTHQTTFLPGYNSIAFILNDGRLCSDA